MGDDITVEFVTGPDSEADDAELEQLTLALRQEILQLDDVDNVEQASAGPAPEGHKAGELAAIGSLVVTAVPGVQAAVKVLQVVRSWLEGRGPSAPTLKMTVGGNSIELAADDKQTGQLVDAFIQSLKNAAPPPATPAAEG